MQLTGMFAKTDIPLVLMESSENSTKTGYDLTLYLLTKQMCVNKCQRDHLNGSTWKNLGQKFVS